MSTNSSESVRPVRVYKERLINEFEQPTAFIVDSSASRCYTSFLRHALEYGGMDVLTVAPNVDNRMDAIMDCIRKAYAVIVSGRPDPDMAVVAGAAYALGCHVVHLYSPGDLTSANLAAVVDTFVSASEDGPAQLWGSLQLDD